jgi:hypothetical protein
MGVASSLQDFLHEVHLANVSEKTVAKAQLGWIVEATGPKPARLVFSGMPFDLNLKAGAWTTVGRQGASLSTVLEFLNSVKAERGKVTVGVISVEFTDGQKWTYFLPARQQFEQGYSEETHRKLTPALQELQNRTLKGGSASQDQARKACSTPPTRDEQGRRPGVLARSASAVGSFFFSIPAV